MQHRLRLFTAVCVCALLNAYAWAGGKTTIPASDFARPSQLTLPSLSPTGEYLAAAVRDNVDSDEKNSYSIAVFHLPDMKPTSKLNVPGALVPRALTWASKTRLVVGFSQQTGRFEQPLPIASILAVEYDGSQQKMLTSSAESTCGVIEGRPDKPNGHFYCSMGGKLRDGVSYIFDVDSSTGRRELLASIPTYSGLRFVLHDGVPLIAYGMDENSHSVIFARDNANQPWKQLDITRHIVPLRFSADGSQLYCLYSASGGPYALAVSDPGMTNFRVLASDSFGDIDANGIGWTPYPQKPFAVTVQTGRPHVTYIDDDNWATVHKALSEQYPGYAINFGGISDDGTRILIQAYSDRDPGFLALFTLSPVSLTPLYRFLPWIQPAQMASRKPIRFKTTTGIELDGYITMPADAKNLPMVLLPHGGPFSLRDSWAFDPWAQFLANRGYAVLQVNYRGSGGRGPAFDDSGTYQISTGMQQDLIDGVHWAIEEGYADKNRICIFGASFGGYSALMAPIRAPGIFKCSIDFAGVSDYAIEFDKSDTSKGVSGRNYFKERIGTGDANIKAISPIYHLDQFNVPVLIVHGEKDERVPIKNAKELRDALDKAGKPYEWLVKPKEGHGFYSEANNTEFLQRMEQFLNKYIGADSTRTANAASPSTTAESMGAH